MQRKNPSTWIVSSCFGKRLPAPHSTDEHQSPQSYFSTWTYIQVAFEGTSKGTWRHYAGSLCKGLKINPGQRSVSVWNGSEFSTTSSIPFHKLGSEAALELSGGRAVAAAEAAAAAVAPRGRTSITRGLSMIRAVRFPFSTMPTIHAW